MEMKVMREVLRRCREPCTWKALWRPSRPCLSRHNSSGVPPACCTAALPSSFLLRTAFSDPSSPAPPQRPQLLRTAFSDPSPADLALLSTRHSARRSSSAVCGGAEFPLCGLCSPPHLRLLAAPPAPPARQWWSRRRYSSAAAGGGADSSPGDATNTGPRTAEPSEGSVVLSFDQGLPHLTVPLPSRRELCRFPLRPVTHTVDTLVKHLQTEDRGIDRVLVRTVDGVRIASSASIESLLLADFHLVINDVTHRVSVPEQARSTMEELTDLSDVRQLVNKLYAALHVDEHQVARERDILQEIEEIRTQLIPLEKHRSKLVSAAERRTSVLMYSGLGYMALQFGFLARLTWWEYSWDIMEPVTYFVTYGTAIACYAYYVLTKHDFLLPEVRDRQFLLGFHRKARKTGMDVGRYNRLKDRLFALESDLRRLRDPLALNLPPERLAKIIVEDASQNTLKTSALSALQEQLKSLLKMRH